ncbi:MAG: mechanosensitive ion channel family protein, partial [Anaerolineae bacterium]
VAEVAYSRLEFLPESWDIAASRVFFILYVVAGMTIILRLAGNFFDWYQGELETSREVEATEQLLPFFRRILRAIVIAIAAIMILDQFGVDVQGLVATLGITSLAIALAAQAALEDTISGFLIILDQPYRIGDRIEIQDLETVGDVQDIGLRSSRVLTLDNRMVIVPNSVIGKSLVVNQSYPDTLYRAETTVGVAYGTEIEKARQTIIEAVQASEHVIQGRPIEALFIEFGDSSLNFAVRYWVNVPIDVKYIQDAVNTAIYDALNRAEIEIPFPQRDVHHKVDAHAAQQIAAALRDGA